MENGIWIWRRWKLWAEDKLTGAESSSPTESSVSWWPSCKHTQRRIFIHQSCCCLSDRLEDKDKISYQYTEKGFWGFLIKINSCVCLILFKLFTKPSKHRTIETRLFYYFCHTKEWIRRHVCFYLTEDSGVRRAAQWGGGFHFDSLNKWSYYLLLSAALQSRNQGTFRNRKTITEKHGKRDEVKGLGITRVAKLWWLISQGNQKSY